MAYTKQNFKPEQVLTAAELNAMDEQIRLNDEKLQNLESSKQDKLIDGSNIKTINGESILGSGNITITGGNTVDTSNLATKDELNAKQDKISDLATIRQGASKGATAIQSVKINGVTKNPSNGVVDLGYISGGTGEINIPVKGVQIDDKSIVNDNGIAIINSSEFKGEKGDTGETGPQGSQGPQGEKGDTGANGIGKFRSIVFRRTNKILTDEDTPGGGNFDNPIPTNTDSEGKLIWSDGIPSDSDEIIWSSTRLFLSDGNHGEWTTPVQMTDTADFEVIYSSKDDPKEPTDGFSKDENGNYNTEWVNNNPDWTDDGNANSIWMATIKASNGVWGSWKVSKIKGEKGEKGETGSDFQIMGIFSTLEELKNTVENPQPGEAYGVGTEKPYDIYIWDDINKAWVNHGAIQGAKGDKGDPAWQSITKFVFTSTSNNEDKFSAPAGPEGGSYDFTTGEFTPPTNGWILNDERLKAPIWISSKTFIDKSKNNAPEEGGWSDPIMISGKDGKDGEDGPGIEYVYMLTKTDIAPETRPEETRPEGSVDANGWYDNPQGVSEEYPCEWVMMRTGTTYAWGEWQGPTLWSKYGANGKDGDGVEYIYYISNSDIAPKNPTPKDYTTNEEYNKSEWLPSKLLTTEGDSYTNTSSENILYNVANIWSDNPYGVDINNMYEYVSVRKKTNGEWGRFSDPKLWSKFSQDGADGAAGRILYFGGNWTKGTQYSADDNSTPYVYDKDGQDGNNYFFLIRDNNNAIKETSPYNNWNQYENDLTNPNLYWKPIPHYEVIYSNVGLFDTANVGPAVFYKDWVFSQADTTGNPNNFHNFTFDESKGIPTSTNRPMMWFNFKTGQGSLAGEKITWNEKGNLEIKANIKVNSLDTKEGEEGDKVKIEGNTVKVLNVDGDENVILSNDVIGDINVHTLVNDSLDVNKLTLAQNIKWSSTSIDGTYHVDDDTADVRPSDNTYFNIGIINAGGTITFNNQVFLLNNLSGVFNYDNIIKPNSIQGSYTNKWSISNSIMDMQNTPSLQIIIEKLNNNKWEPVNAKNPSTSGNSQEITWTVEKEKIPNVSSSGPSLLNDYTCYNGKYTFTAPERGIYRAQVQFMPETIQTKSENVCKIAKAMTFASTYKVTRNFTDKNFTEIGKNGIIVKGKDNVFVIDENEITMSNATYGLKLNSTGFYRWNYETSKWIELNLSMLDKK